MALVSILTALVCGIAVWLAGLAVSRLAPAQWPEPAKRALHVALFLILAVTLAALALLLLPGLAGNLRRLF